jgi:hypothetical protein
MTSVRLSTKYSKGSTMQHETIKDYLTAVVVGIVGALALLHSLDALFY